MNSSHTRKVASARKRRSRSAKKAQRTCAEIIGALFQKRFLVPLEGGGGQYKTGLQLIVSKLAIKATLGDIAAIRAMKRCLELENKREGRKIKIVLEL